MLSQHFVSVALKCVSGTAPYGAAERTVRNLHFLSKNSTFDFSRKLLIFLGGEKLPENVVVLDFLAVDNFNFTRKIVKKKIG